ncbi:stAR-related lipid transfer protein 9 isoform X6 [Camelus ferus]|uniref:StAR-related lipid transfer protein 9 n=1 Tax=Camelus ferus TaxID=419612 RepID=A0A8B8T5N1_CAMFR|nr:stAR-related lipid transfer protein 9 isoform X6 [Camelus ferus]
MANVRVAVRVRPLSKRETKEGGRIIVEVDGKVAKIRNLKVDGRLDGFGDSREKVVAFGFDYCYWSVNPEDPQYASQDVVFQDLGTEVLSGAAKGYNICLFAYGQTGSGKTYTMLGTPASVGLTPRICEGLFVRQEDCAPLPSSCRIKVSFLEIYNERVRDLLKQSDHKKSYTLRVREHPEMGPYVQGLSQHVVTNYKQVIQLLEEGIANRITAATHVHEASSRSHAIFTIYYTQAILENNLPSEIASKINLVDLAGSERADPSYCKDRITEGANINKSLVTLGIVISTLAQNSQVFSCQSFNSTASDGGDSGVPSSPSGTSSGGGPSRRRSYIPYRDSVLTWLLKDSLGGNSRTIMVATVSPAHTSYSETMSTLRYASNAKNIINKPRVNEDANVKLIRELREEIGRLKAMLLSFELRNFRSLNEGKDENLKELVLQNELKIDQLTKDWTRKWNEWKALVEHYRVDINRRRAGLVIDSSLPHLMALEDDVLSTGVVLYHLKEGTTKIGRIDSDQEQDIVLQGQWIERDHCTITSACGVVVLRPARGARCTVNGREVTASCRLTQGAVITLGKAQKFRFNHPAEAAVLRQRRQVGEAVGGSGSLEWLDLDGDVTASRLGLSPLLWKERRVLGEQSDGARQPPSAGETPPGTQVQQQQCYVGDLRQRIVAAQIRARQTPELDRTSISRRIKDRFFWFPDKQRLLGEETRPSGLQQQPQQDRGAEREVEAAVPSDSRCRTDPETQPSSLVQSQKRTVQPQLLRRHTLRVAERSFRRRRVLFQLERIVKKQRLLEAHRRPELLKALCLLQDGHPQRRPGPGTLVPGPQCRSRLRSYSSLSLQRPCSWHSPQLRSVSLSLDTFTTSPPMPDPTDQLSEKISSEEYLPQATSYCPRTGHCSKHALRSSGKGQLCTARKALAGTGASAPGICFSVGSESASVQEMERVAFPELLMPEGPQGKERDLPEPENSESDDSQISEDSLAEKGCRSLRDSPGDSYLTSGHGHPRARAGASVRVFTTSSDSGLFTQTQKSFSLDSLIDTEEELGDHRQEEPFFISADEMPTETFWHLQPSSLPGGDQEAACRLGAIKHRTGARLDAILPVSSSFYLDPQPPCEQPELAVEANSSERAHAVQDVHLSRGSPLVSVDSWFSCDSKINPSSPSDSLCPSPNVQDFQPCGWKRPGYWLNTGELKSSGTEIALPYSSELPQGGAELPCSVRGVHAIPASDMTRLSLWGPYRLLQSRADGTFQARGVPDAAQQGISEASDSSVSSLLAASATSFTYIGSAGEREWAALQQKYLLELSHPALEATEEPRSAFASLEGDSGSLTQASDKGGDALLPVGSGVPRSLDFSSFPIHLSKIKRLRAEKEQDSLSVEIEGTSDFFTASEKVSCSGTYSADVESSASGMTHAQASAAENKTVHPVREAHEVKENSLEESSQSSQKPELMTSSDECFFLKSPCHSVVTIATKDHHRPRGRAPFGRSSADQAGQSGQSGQCPPQEENTDSQESSQEAVERHSSLPFALLSGPELYLHSAPWNPLPSSLQPPPLETFYVTKSRDALTETALEIPACREARMPSPPPREAWGFGPNHRVIQNVSVKNKLPVPSHNQNSKMVPSQQGTAERPVVQNTEEVNEEKWKRPGNVKEDNHNSVYFFVSQNRHFLPSTSVKVCEFENQVGILNKHSLPTLRQGEKASVQSSCGVSSDSAGSGEPLFVCEPETGGEEEQGQSAALRQTQAFDTKRQFHSGIRSELIYKTISLGLDKDMLGEAALSLKPRPVHHRVSSPETAAQEESPTHEGEGRNETGLLGKALHPKDGSEEFKFPQTESTCGRVQSVTRSQERSHSESKVPGKAQEMFNSREAPSGKKWNKQGKSHCTGKLRHFLGASEQFLCHSSSSDVIEKRKEATRRTPSSADPLGSDRLPSPTAVEEDRKVTAEEAVAALPSQAPFDDPGGIPHGQGQFAAWEAAENVPPASQKRSPAHQEPGTLDNTGSGNFLEAAQGGKTTCFESQLLICDVENSACLSGPNQDQVQCLEASASLEEGRASPRQGTVLPGALRGVEPEAPSQQHVKRETSVGSGPAEACRAGSEGPRPAAPPDRRPTGVREEVPRRCPQEISGCVASWGSTEGSRTLRPSGGQEDSETHSCRQPCDPQPIAPHARSSPSMPVPPFPYRGGDLGKGTSKAAPHTCHPPCMVASRARGMDERGEGHSREPDMLLACGLEPKGINVELRPADGDPPEPSIAAAVLPLAQGGHSLSAPDGKTSSLSHLVADKRSVGDPEKTFAEKKAGTELEASPFLISRCSEPPRRFQDSSAGGQRAQGSQPKPGPPATAGRPHTLNLSEGSVGHELLMGPQDGTNAIRCLPEKSQRSSESRDHSGLDPQAKFVAKLKYISSPWVDSPWEEEEQQRDQASGGGEDPTRGSSPLHTDEGCLGSCQIRGAGGEEMAVPRPTVSKMFSSGFGDSATVHLEHRGARGPVAQGSGPPSPGGEQLEPHHRRSLPVIAISGPRHYGPQFSVVSSSRSLQELNLSVEPPSPTDEKIQEPRRLWTPHLGGSSSGKSVVRPSLKAEGCDQEASPDLGDSAAVPRRLQSAPTPYPTTSALSCMPTPDLMASLEQAQQGKPERLGGQARPEEPQSEAGGGALPSGSSDINPCVLPWRPEGPVCIGWKQYGFGSAVDVSRGHTSQGLIPPSVARSSSIDDGLGDQNSPLRSHRSTCASARGLLSTCSSIQEARGSHEPWEVWGSSFALGTPHILLSSEGAAPTHGPDRRAQFPGTPDEASGLRREPPRAEGSAAGPVDEIMLLYPAEAGDPAGQPRMSTLEQGTQTPGCRPCWSYTDICSAQSDLASWASMHNLSLHLSQLLHSTSELLGSLSQPSVAEKERNAKRETPGEAPQALMMDGCTQTTMDEAVQTDRASLPLHLQAPEANSQKISVVLDRLGSVMSAMSQKQRHVPGTLQKRKTEETGWKTTGPLDLQEESTHCRPQSLPVLSPHLSFQKVPFGQNLLSVSPQPSPDASLPPSPRPEEPSCLAVSSPGLSASPSPGRCSDTAEFFRQPRVQKAQRPTSALLVDRASSPILTLSASPQGLGLPLGALSLSAPSALSLEGRRNHISSPGLPLCAPRPPVGHYSHTTDESGSSQRLGAPCGEGRSSLEGGDRRSFLEASSSGSPQQSTKLQVRFVEQPLQRHQPRTTTRVQSRPLPPAPRSRNQRGADGFVPEDMASLACDPLSSRGPSQRQSRTESGGESSASPKPPLPTLDIPSSQGGPQCRSPCPFFELTETLGLQGCILGPTEACQPEGLLRPSSQMHTAPEPQHHSLGDLPVHNKFSDWCGVQDGFPGGLGVMDLPGARCDCSSGEQGQRPPEPPADQSQAPEWSQREQIPLQVGAQNLSLSVELTEAKLHHGFGEADALLQVLQSGTGEALAAEEPEPHPQGELYAWPKQTLENLRRERAERLQNFRRARSLSPQKQLSFPSSWDLPTRDLGLPSRRREYLQQLRRDVVETTRSPGSASRSAHPPSDIELMLQEYQRAREEAKVEIARARDRLRERTEQEKLRIRQQIISQLLRVGRGQASDFREEEKLHTLAASSSRCTSSDGSLSSGVTSGYNSSPALPGQLQSPDSVVDTNLPDSRDSWMGDVRGRSAVRNSHLNLAGSAWKSLAYSRRASLGSCCCSPSSLSSLGTSSSSSYRDLAKHIVDISMADVMAACSDNLNNLFSHRAAAGWNHQGEEQEVQLYNKVFSSTRHGFLGAGVVSQPLSHVWAAVSDPTLWPLYHQPIQTARLHQRVTNSINLVYLVCNTALCALKQPRDFCCVCVEAKEGPLSIMAAQSVYDVSMPRPSREMVRGEILPSAWILQPLTVEGKEVTRVIYLAQVELGAPGFPPQLLSSFIKQQPLVIARLASFLGS